MDRKVVIGTSTKQSDQNYSIKAAGDTAYVILDDDKFDLITVAPTIARTEILPTLADNQGRVLTILNLNGVAVVTVDGEGAETINGRASEPLVSANNFITVVGTPATWVVLARKQDYETAYINRSDWTNVHPGTDDTLNVDSNVTHNLDAPYSDLIIKIIFSTDGTDANSFEARIYEHDNATLLGLTFYGVDNNNIQIQTAAAGIPYIVANGTGAVLDDENWYYKIVVQRR